MREKVNSAEALVAYLDILGYSELIKSGGYANIYYGAIDAAISRWRRFVDIHKYNIGEIVKRHVTLEIMGDAFIVILDQQAILSEEENDSVKPIVLMIFFTLISFLVQDCMRAIKRLFRGAIVKGPYYQQRFQNLKSGTFIFSKALCDAYELEKDIVNIPRILVDKSVLEKVDFSLLCKEGRPDRELLRDDDGFYYLNIYSSMFTDTALASILREVASIIKANIKKCNKSSILRKYIWFANYHNRIVKRIIETKAAIPCIDEIEEKQTEMLIEIPNL